MQLRRRPAPAGDDTLFSQLSVLHDMVKWDAGRPFLPTIARHGHAATGREGVVTVATRALKRGGGCKPDDGRDGEGSPH